MKDDISYLNHGSTRVMTHRLLDLLRESSQKKAPAKQWVAFISALSQKGVKASEMQASGLIELLGSDSMEKVYLRDDLIESASKRMACIKEVALNKGYFSGWRYPGGEYKEFLYIANSEKDGVLDEIEEVRFDIEDLNFNMERILDEPDLLSRLENRLLFLAKSANQVSDFAQHHYSDVLEGRHGKNLVAHVRRTIRGSVYFIDEVQSDWAQKGRMQSGVAAKSKFEAGAIPVGPYVTNTEDWAGMVMRRHAALAALDPAIGKFAWITADMRNGGRCGANDGLDEFYTRIIPKIMEKAISKSGGKVSMSDIELDGKTFSVPGFEMTDEVREALKKRQPMYSRMCLDSRMEHPDAVKNAVLFQCEEMLGSAASVRFLNRLYDIQAGVRVAGRYTKRVVELSLEAQHLDYSANHEVFHAAADLMISERERRMIRSSFEPGSFLNHQVKDALLQRGELKAAAQCEDYEEAAAHGFALWRAGDIQVKEPEIEGIFGRVVCAIRDFGNWLNRRVFADGHQTPEDLFESLRNGELARRQEAAARKEVEAAV